MQTFYVTILPLRREAVPHVLEAGREVQHPQQSRTSLMTHHVPALTDPSCSGLYRSVVDHGGDGNNAHYTCDHCEITLSETSSNMREICQCERRKQHEGDYDTALR